MDRQEYEWLRSGIGKLDELLAMTPAEAVIDRMSLESERERIVAKLDAFTPPARPPATASHSFDGDPVEGPLKETKLANQTLTLEVTVITTDGVQTVHEYVWPTDRNDQTNLIKMLSRCVQAGFLDPTIGVIKFDHPSVVYNPAHFVRAGLKVTGPESQQSTVEAENRRLGFLQDEPGRG